MSESITEDFIYALWTDTKGFEISQYLMMKGSADLIKKFADWSVSLVKVGWIENDTVTFLKEIVGSLDNLEASQQKVLENDACRGIVKSDNNGNIDIEMIYNCVPQDVGAPDVSVLHRPIGEAAINLPRGDKKGRSIAANAFDILLGDLKTEDGQFFSSKKSARICVEQGEYRLIALGGTRRRFEYIPKQ